MGKPVAFVLTPGQQHEASVFEQLMSHGAMKRPGSGRPRKGVAVPVYDLNGSVAIKVTAVVRFAVTSDGEGFATLSHEKSMNGAMVPSIEPCIGCVTR